MELGKVIAYNLKKLRTARNMTLGQLSKVSGISKAMLSDIEKGGSNPTINTLWKIANGLNAPYTRLLEGVELESELVRREDAAIQIGETEHYRVYCYFPTSPTRNFELFYCELDPHSTNATIGHSDGEREYIYVIEGELTLQTSAGNHTIRAGDAFTFDSSVGHAYVNNQDSLLKLIMINFYPV